ncbi:MAG: hypothetical protein Kow0092_26070 [Deferrisomatales bacterium]
MTGGRPDTGTEVPGGGRKVLVVEDSRTINDLVAESLETAGYRCVRAFDGQEALEVFGAETPDAVVLDLSLPRVHGLEVLRRVKEARPFTVVIVLTGHGSEQTAFKALQSGADEYIRKPFREARLLESLQLHLDRADLQKCLDVQGPCPAHVEERFLARVFFDAPAALVHVDPSGTIRAVNRAASRLLARSPDQLLGTALGRLVGEDVREGWVAAVRRGAAAPAGYEGEVWVEGAAGPFPARVLAVERPEPGHLIVALKDLTRQKELEKRYFESKRLASLGRVVEGVAHEVRNPLISIGGFARKLAEAPGQDPKTARYLGVILSEVERLEQMVRDIEAFVQFSSHRRTRVASMDAAEILQGCVSRVREEAERSGIEVSLALPEGLPRIYADPALVRELFDGLIENALEAMSDGGRLAVDARVVDNWVQVRVEDTGVGMSEKDLEEIFDPFFTSKTSGTGLGLAKAYLIVEEHAGTIDFESQLGEGTVCTVSLPIDRRRVPRQTA